jgi:hypothetical protein
MLQANMLRIAIYQSMILDVKAQLQRLHVLTPVRTQSDAQDTFGLPGIAEPVV